MLVERLKEEKDGKNIAAVLAVCTYVMLYDDAMRGPLIEGGFAAPLVRILNSRLDQLDVVEMGLQAAARVAMMDCEKMIVFLSIRLCEAHSLSSQFLARIC